MIRICSMASPCSRRASGLRCFEAGRRQRCARHHLGRQQREDVEAVRRETRTGCRSAASTCPVRSVVASRLTPPPAKIVKGAFGLGRTIFTIVRTCRDPGMDRAAMPRFERLKVAAWAGPHLPVSAPVDRKDAGICRILPDEPFAEGTPASASQASSAGATLGIPAISEAGMRLINSSTVNSPLFSYL
jgi:hypothetical protein